jgi:hypothetical protein
MPGIKTCQHTKTGAQLPWHVFVVLVLGVELRASYMLQKHCATKLLPSSFLKILFWDRVPLCFPDWLWTCYSPVSASQVAEIISICHHARLPWHVFIYLEGGFSVPITKCKLFWAISGPPKAWLQLWFWKTRARLAQKNGLSHGVLWVTQKTALPPISIFCPLDTQFSQASSPTTDYPALSPEPCQTTPCSLDPN